MLPYEISGVFNGYQTLVGAQGTIQAVMNSLEAVQIPAFNGLFEQIETVAFNPFDKFEGLK